MEFLINFDDSLVNESAILNFIGRLIDDLLHQNLPQGLQICSHTVKVTLNNNELIHGFSQPQQSCQCLSETASQNEQIIRLLFYLLSKGKEQTERIQCAKQNIDNPKLTNLFFYANLEDFQKCFSYYELFQNNDPILQNLESMIEYANNNEFPEQLAFYIMNFPRISLKIVHLCNGFVQSQVLESNRRFISFQKLLRFVTKASFHKYIQFEPICQHNVIFGPYFVDRHSQSIPELQLTQIICNECRHTDFCSSIGQFLLQTVDFADSSSSLLNILNLQLLERIREGQIKSLSFINELVNPDFVDEACEIDLLVKTFDEITPKSFIGREQVILEIEFYKAHFIKKTRELVLDLINTERHSDLKLFWFLFSLQLNVQLNRILRMIKNPQSVQLQNLDMLKNSVKAEIDRSNAELKRLNSDYAQSEDQTLLTLIEFYPDKMNDFKLNEFEQILVPNNQNLDVKTAFRILCCIHLDNFFDYKQMLKTMKPYLIKTIYKHGIQVHEFEKFINNARNQSELQVIKEMINILNELP